MGVSTIKSKESGGLAAFLKKKDPNLESLKDQYFKNDESSALKSQNKSAYKPSDTQFTHYTDVENFIEKQVRKKQVVSWRQQFWAKFDSIFLIKLGHRSVYFWHSRAFEEILLMHLPRFIFLAGSIYTIYTISLKNRQAANWRNGVTSHRQEEIRDQLRQIESVIKPKENTFEPGKQVEFDASYKGDEMNYQHQSVEQELQDKLFQMYEEINDDGDEGYGYEPDES